MRTNAMQATQGQPMIGQAATGRQGTAWRWMRRQADIAEPSGYGSGRGSPVGIGGAIVVHALVIGVWLLIPKEMIDTVLPRPFETYAVPQDKAPPPEPTEPVTEPASRTRASDPMPTATDPVVTVPMGDPVVTGTDSGGAGVEPGPDIILPPADPPRAAVLVDAAIDPRALPAFQPDYPGAMIRQGMEGTVTVRVSISAEGRVTDIARIAASDESFWIATQRHALRKWRFRAATRDGLAVASSKVLTVRFTLTDR